MLSFNVVIKTTFCHIFYPLGKNGIPIIPYTKENFMVNFLCCGNSNRCCRSSCLCSNRCYGCQQRTFVGTIPVPPPTPISKMLAFFIFCIWVGFSNNSCRVKFILQHKLFKVVSFKFAVKCTFYKSLVYNYFD